MKRYILASILAAFVAGIVMNITAISTTAYAKSVVCSDGKTIEFPDPDHSAGPSDYDAYCKAKGHTGYGQNPTLPDVMVCENNDTIFGIPAWYKGMQNNKAKCAFEPKKSSDGSVDVTKTTMLIGMNIMQAALVVVAYITIIMLIRGGFTYMLSTGSPDGISSAKKIIRNAIIGLVIALLSASIVNAVAGIIAK